MVSTLSLLGILLINIVFGSLLCVGHAFPTSQRRGPFTTTIAAKRRPGPNPLESRSAPDSTPTERAVPVPSRREILRTLVPVLSGTVLAVLTPARPANAAAVAQPTAAMEKVKTMTPVEARERLSEAQRSLEYLLEHFDEISGVGGDNVRRYLGTVGTSSGMYGITKAMKVLQGDANDVVEYTETMNEVNACINGADGSAYMAIFVTSSTSQTPPQKYFDEAKIETKRALKSLRDLEKVL